MRIKIVFLAVLFFLSVTNVFADTILLKSGKTVEGNIVEQTDDSVKLEVEGIPLTYYVSDIDSINGQKMAVASSGDQSSNVRAVNAQENFSAQMQSNDAGKQVQTENSVPKETEVSPIDKEMFSDKATEPLGQENEMKSTQAQIIPKKDSPASDFDMKYSRRNSLTPEQARVAAGVFAGVFLFIAIIVVLFYVYSALCLYFIAKKTAIEPAWLSWIPVANAFLMCKIAGVSYLWLIGLLVQLLPFIGILGSIYSVGLFIYLWYKIILIRNKPAWLVILMFVPIANFVVMGYLAFSE
ncbi:MAG: hypothetical protein WC412_05630 [Candidatus Omnitrophota bacterium]|jgi:membrane-associated HD superfamily phosphohydrolase